MRRRIEVILLCGAGLLNLLELQGVEIQRTDKEFRIPAAPAETSDKGRKRDDAAPASNPDKKSSDPAEKKPVDTVIPVGSYVVRMDQPYSRLADAVLDTQYYNPRDPRSYDDTGWTLGAWCELRRDFRNFRLDRVANVAIGNRFPDEPGKRLEDFLRAMQAP